jgi:hypothetical protein
MSVLIISRNDCSQDEKWFFSGAAKNDFSWDEKSVVHRQPKVSCPRMKNRFSPQP